MRTRKVRNFGHDITNQGSVTNAHVYIDGNSKKDESGADIDYVKEMKQIVKPKAINSEPQCLSEYAEQIMAFGMTYFEKIMEQPYYVSIIKNKCEQNLPQGEQKQNIPTDLMFPSSPQLTHSMRITLIEWVIEVHHKMKLRYQTLYLAILLIDKVCAKKIIKRSEYQLLAMACLFLAGKYEEVATPKIKKIMDLCDRLYQPADLLRMESEILLELNFKISQPTLDWFIGVEIFFVVSSKQDQASKITTQKFRRTCFYMAQICLFQIQLLKKFSPQVVSNTIVYTVSMKSQFLNFDVKICTNKLNPKQMKQMRQCISHMRKLYSQRLSIKYQVVNNKYPDLVSEQL